MIPAVNLPSLIELWRTSLESGLNQLDAWLIVFTGTVVIGLFLEYAPEFLEKAARSGTKWGFKHKPAAIEILSERAWYPRWMKRFEVLGALLVVSGVTGELYNEFRRSEIEASLREVDNSILAGTGKQAADAIERAGKANERAGELELEAEKLRIAVADRDVSVEQQRKIKASLAKFKGSVVWIRSYPNDGEAARLILELKAALAPEISVEDRTGQLMGQSAPSSPVLGIAIEPSRDRGFAEALVSSFRNDGQLSVADLTPFGSGLEVTEILVGLKPVALAQVTASIASTAKQSPAPPRTLTPRQQADITETLEALPGLIRLVSCI